MITQKPIQAEMATKQAEQGKQPIGFMDALLAKLKSGHPDQDVEALRLEASSSLQQPETMTKPVYLALQAITESIEMGAARGEEHPSDEQYQSFIDDLMISSPWTLHPDFGCIATKEVEALEGSCDSMRERPSR